VRLNATAPIMPEKTPTRSENRDRIPE
jgi:hypothetical protein